MKAPSRGLLVRQNVRRAKQLYPTLRATELKALIELTRTLQLSVMRGELLCLDGKWYVSHAGLLRIAVRRRCAGIRTALQERQSDPVAGRWVFKATVYKSTGSCGFGGYGDADPTNVSQTVRGAEMRVAETRAVNRALRKAYGIGICSVEELGSFSGPRPPAVPLNRSNGSHTSNGRKSDGQPRLRDQLCALIRQYNLDPNLVKAYAADFCGTETLSSASRDLIESFVAHLAASAKEKREALICKLNSYSQPQEVRS